MTQKYRRSTRLEASKEVGLQVNADKTKHMSISRDHSAGENHHLMQKMWQR